MTLALIGFILANIGVYAGNSVFWTLPQTYLPRNQTAAGLGIISTLGSLAGFGITTAIGRVQEETHSLTSCFAIVIGILVVVMVVVFLLDRLLKAAPKDVLPEPSDVAMPAGSL